MDASYFDVVIDRTQSSGSHSSKWLGVAERFPEYDPEGVLPMWVADMDFRCPPEVIEAVKTRAEHGIYGYTDNGLVRKFIEAAADWMERRYGWRPDPSWGIFTPGVMPALNAAIQEFTQPGDGVIIQSPVYSPFADGPKKNGRMIRQNCLIEKEPGYYVMDYDNLEKLAADPQNKLLILSSPHNPVGRVWSREELARACEICLKHQVLVISDEIHADLIMKGHQHTPTGSISTQAANNMIAAYAPSKTFNLAGLCASVVIVPNEEIRERLKKRIFANRLPASNVFGPLAGEVAYRTGDEYVDILTDYIGANMDYVIQCCQNMPGIRARKSEGTYLLWMDFRGLGMKPEEVDAFVIQKAKIAGDFGTWFGSGGEGFLRLNLACPKKIVEQAMKQLKEAYDQLKCQQ